MKHLKEYKIYFESHSVKKDIISQEEFQQIIANSNEVTLPFFDNESALLHHIEKNFDENDVAVMENPSQELTSVKRDGESIFLYTKHKTYIVKNETGIEID